MWPAEDAAILFQIAANFADTGVIAYNLDDGRAEGATDFLWMALIAGLSRLGMGEFAAASLLSAAAMLATVALVGSLAGPRRWLSVLACALGLAAAPMLPAAIAGFSNVFFGSIVLATAVLAVSRVPWAFYLVGLLCCLVRPDGVLFVGSACLCRWAMLSGVAGAGPAAERHWRDDIAPALTATALGIGYFAWRWTYFGEVLPLPLMVKSSCEVRFFGLCRGHGALPSLALYGVLAAAALGFFLAREERARWPLGLSVFCSLATLPLLAYGAMALEQNVADRFFYPAYLAAVTLAALGLGAPGALTRPARAAGIVLVLLLALASRSTGEFWRLATARDNAVPIALALREVRPAGRLGVTEAGLLPYLSGWPTADLWGLNTRRFARRLFSPEDVHGEGFDLVVAHAGAMQYESYLSIPAHCGRPPETARGWFRMITNLYAGICAEGPSRYETWLVPRWAADVGVADPGRGARGPGGREPRYDAFFLRRDYAAAAEVRSILVRHGALNLAAYAERRRRIRSAAETPG